MESTITTQDLTKEIISNLSFEDTAPYSAYRKKALDAFHKTGLPDKKNEEYRFTPITAVLEKKINWNLENSESKISSITPFLINELDAYVIVLVNGKFSKKFSKLNQVEPGIKIKTFGEAWSTEKNLVEKYIDQLINCNNDPFASLNSALWQEGIFIHVDEAIKVKKPVLILHINDASASQIISHTKALVIIEREAELSLIEKSSSTGEENIFHTFSEELVIQENALLNYVKIQHDEGNLYQVATSAIRQSDNSKLNTFTLTLNGKLIRNNFNIVIDGENCESHFYGLYLLNGNTLADNHTVVDHIRPNSYSNELYKGVMDENSKAIFNGKIYVRPHAQKTNAFQSNRNILLTDTATINTKPQLEIWADDVKCSHGCTTGQLDEEALFYLRSRGISQATAKAMLLYAFAAETLEPIRDEILKTYLDNLISERLHKNF